MTNEIKISIREYAKQLKVDESAVRKAIADGKIKQGVVYVQRNVNGKKKKVPLIVASVANKEWGFLHENPKPQRGVSKKKAADKLDQKGAGKKIKEKSKSDENNEADWEDLEENLSYSELAVKIKLHPQMSYQEALRKSEVLEAAMTRMKLEEQSGILVKKADVDKALFAVGDELKKKLLNIPARAIDDILAAPNKIEAGNILTFEINQALQTLSQIGTN